MSLALSPFGALGYVWYMVATSTVRLYRRAIWTIWVTELAARVALTPLVMPGTRIPYTVNLPLARAVEEDVLLVHTWEGQPLPREHGGPCRMITPKLYAWKGAKWIRKIEFLAEDQKGFWEVRGYSNTAEPWFNDRYASE